MKYRVTRATTSMRTYDVEARDEADAIGAVTGPGQLVGTSDLWSAVAVEPVPVVPLSLPTGFGGYLRRITGGAAEAAAAVDRCKRAGFDWVALMVEASDGFVVDLNTTKVYARALRDAGFGTYVWSFPGDKRAASELESTEAAELALDYADATASLGVIMDIEAPYKSKPETLRALLGTVQEGLRPEQVLGVSCYPVPSMHPTVPWDVIIEFIDFGSPMFYETAQNPEHVADGLTQWAAITPVIVPVLDGWSGSGAAGAARFKADIIAVLGQPPDPKLDMGAASIWSESQMDDAKRAVTSEMGSAYGWPKA